MAQRSRVVGAVDVPADQIERRLTWLLGARLALTLLSLGVAIGLDGLGRDLSEQARSGLYATVLFAFSTTVVSAVLLQRVRSAYLLMTAQIATDVAIVTALVHFSGGQGSIFTFLYVLVTVYGAVLFERRGAMVAASLSTVAYGAVLFGARFGLLPDHSLGVAQPLSVVVATWSVHVAALYLVGLLASVLSGELHRTVRALHQSTSDLSLLRDLHKRTVESIMSGLLTIDPEGFITSFNPEAERVTGLPAAAAIGRNLENVIPGAMEVAVRERAERSEPQSGRTRLLYVNEAGQERWLGLAGSALRKEDGSDVGRVVIFQDVTDVVSMERKLRGSERMAAVGEMAAKIAHEIRNPLASISGSIEILRDGGLDDSGGEPEALMNIVVRETDRLNRLITDFLQFSRPVPPCREEVVLSDLIEEVTKVLRSTLPPEITLSVPTASTTAVHADSSQLRQVLWNLCLNAIQAMPKGGELKLEVHSFPSLDPQGTEAACRNGTNGGGDAVRDEGMVEFCVSDTGEGIPVEVQEQIFEPFFTTKQEGTGLGLATVHRIIESHDGEMQLESRVGMGTTFRVRLPRPEVTE